MQGFKNKSSLVGRKASLGNSYNMHKSNMAASHVLKKQLFTIYHTILDKMPFFIEVGVGVSSSIQNPNLMLVCISISMNI